MVILHSDLNSFYPSIECLYNRAIRNLPVAVCGKKELRHGVVVSANVLAKRYGVIVGEDTIGSALKKCPELIIVTINQALYDQFPAWAKEVYVEYSDYVENYGPDGSWLDISKIARDEYDGRLIADAVRADIKETIGITCSVGVSFNKTISKLAAEQKKPDATTVISRVKFKEIVWKMPPEKLLGVNAKTNRILYAMGMTTIGDIAKVPVELFEDIFGKNGRTLHKYASGEENSPVKHKNYIEPTKTIGHIHTTPRDMTTIDDVRREIYSLSEKVTSEMRKQHFKCQIVQINIRSNDLKCCDRQGKLEVPSYITNNIAEKAMEIFMKQYNFTKPLRSIGVRVNDLIPDDIGIQSSFFYDMEQEIKREKVAYAMDMIRSMYGYDIIQRGLILENKEMTNIPAEYNRASYRVGSAFF